MAFMGYETPVEMPSMGVYDTDLMKMYIAGVKDQYEKGREEMKDFMKLYGDFYSPIAGDTLRYNDLTVGGARDMINQMLANGIDPYKSPEARAAISRYINSVPTGVLNAMKQNAENRKAYDQAVAQARLSGKYDPEYEAWALKQAGLDNFSTVGPNGEIRVWDRLAPDPKLDWADIAAPYLKEFEKTEILKSDRPGYVKEGVSDENLKKGIEAVMNAASSTPWLLYKLQQAYDRTAGLTDTKGNLLSEGARKTLAAEDVRKLVENTAAQYYQPKYIDDWKYKSDYETANNIRQYWATTGSNPNSSTGRGSRTNGRSTGGAHGESGRYSRYASITFGTLGNRDDYAKTHKILYTANGKPSYAEYVTINQKTGEKALVVLDAKGNIVLNGKKYRKVSQGAIQRQMFADIIKKNSAEGRSTGMRLLWKSQAVKTGNDAELTNITYNAETAGYLYTIDDVMSGARGVSAKNNTNGSNSVRNRVRSLYAKYVKYAKDVENDKQDAQYLHPVIIKDTHEAADIVMKNGKIGKYTKVIVDYGKGPQEMLYKLGEYDGDYNMVSTWSGRMAENDRIMSAASVGESDAVEIYNY